MFFYFPTSPILCTYFTLGNCQDLNIALRDLFATAELLVKTKDGGQPPF